MNETLDNESINRPGSPMEPPPSVPDNYLTIPGTHMALPQVVTPEAEQKDDRPVNSKADFEAMVEFLFSR